MKKGGRVRAYRRVQGSRDFRRLLKALRNSERRRDVRVRVKQAAAQRCEISIPRVRGRGLIKDLSIGGVRLGVRKRVRVGDRVAFGLNLRKGRKIELVEGVVRWVKKTTQRSTLGIEFVKISLIDKFSLLVFLDRQARTG